MPTHGKSIRPNNSRLPNGAAVAAIVTNDSATNLELAVGKQATALFKASSVILGVPA